MALIGRVGSGSINAEFEVKPPDHLEKYLPSLASNPSGQRRTYR